MKVEQLTYERASGWRHAGSVRNLDRAQLVLAFFGPRPKNAASLIDGLRTLFPEARIVSATTGGQILGSESLDCEATATAICFEQSTFRIAATDLTGVTSSRDAGNTLGRTLVHSGLSGIFVLSEGLNVNGTELSRGLRDAIGADIPITGGLAGDGDAFAVTQVGIDEPPRENQVAAIGLYGDSIHLACSYAGGWAPFGPQRTITRSDGNVLYELDGQPALDLYKRYLSDEAANLPASALLFPLHLRAPDDGSKEMADGVVRTVLGVDEETRSLTFAGDMPQGALAQLMTATIDNLITGAAEAGSGASRACANSNGTCAANDTLAIFVSCIGRKLLLGQRTSEEVEAASAALPSIPVTGFYSYGEFAPEQESRQGELHNQTMAVTVICES